MLRETSRRFDKIDRELRVLHVKVDAIFRLLRPQVPPVRIPTTLVLHVGTPTQEL